MLEIVIGKMMTPRFIQILIPVNYEKREIQEGHVKTERERFHDVMLLALKMKEGARSQRMKGM